jgi:hypothetical protein
VRPAGAEAKRLAHTRAARARDHFRGKPCRPAYIPPMDMKAEIERMEAQIERLTALVQQLRQREDEITAELLANAEERLKSARQSLERAKAV